SNDGTLCLWDAKGRRQSLTSFRPLSLHCASISESGKLIATLENGAPLEKDKLWLGSARDPKSRIVREISVTGTEVDPKLLFSRDDRYLALIDTDGTIWIWQLPATELLKISGAKPYHRALAFSKDSRLFACSVPEGKIAVFELSDKRS